LASSQARNRSKDNQVINARRTKKTQTNAGARNLLGPKSVDFGPSKRFREGWFELIDMPDKTGHMKLPAADTNSEAQ
jgi:hypothetical protein